jgi:hypothetical protein
MLSMANIFYLFEKNVVIQWVITTTSNGEILGSILLPLPWTAFIREGRTIILGNGLAQVSHGDMVAPCKLAQVFGDRVLLG